MDKKLIQFQAILTKANPTVDRGMSLGFRTRELSHEEKVVLMEKLNSEGWLLFKENEFVTPDVPEGNAETGSRTPSERLRDVIFVYYKQKDSKSDFELFYRNQMEVIIEAMKRKLEPK